MLPARSFLLCLCACAAPLAAQTLTSAAVYPGAGGRLEYATDAEGNRVPDFSDAGYRGGGVPIPRVSAAQAVSPVDGDDTASIQAAIDAVSARTPDADGLRGAVVLAAGTYQVQGTLRIRESGVVLRGAGDGEDPAANTVFRRTGAIQAPLISVGRSESAGGEALIRRVSTRPPSEVADDVIPIGARTFAIDNPERFDVGDPVVLFHPATLAWVNAVDGGGTASDPRWGVGQDPVAYARTVVRKEGNQVTLDAPTFYRMVASISTPYLYIRETSNTIQNVGVESLRIDIETASALDETQARNAVEFELVENAWAEGVTALHFWHAGISIQNSRYVTVRGCQALEPHSIIDGERRYNFEVYRSQMVLFEGNRASNARHAFVGNGESLDSGIVMLENTSANAFTSSEAHRRWGTGFLFDGHIETGSRGTGTSDRRIHLGNRGDFGSSHGWACANCVVWNAQMNGALVIVEKPPTAQNYAIGVQGTVSTRGPFVFNSAAYIELTNMPGLEPASLYRRQLADRQRPVAVGDDPADGVLRLGAPAPNPTAGLTQLPFELAVAADVRVVVVDVLGREVAVVAEGRRAAGPHTATVDASRLAPGTYVARLTTGGVVRVSLFTVIR